LLINITLFFGFKFPHTKTLKAVPENLYISEGGIHIDSHLVGRWRKDGV
jgi:hypothetical protein